MVTKIAVRVSDGAIVSTVAVTAPNDENRNNYEPPKNNDDEKIAAMQTAVKHNHLNSNASNQVDADNNMSTTHVIAKAKDEKKSTATGTRRSNRQKRPVAYNDYVDEDARSDKKKRRRKQGKEKKFIIDFTDVPMQVPILRHDGKKGGLSSKYLGVNWDKRKNKWIAQITIDGKLHYIGYYDKEEDAATHYARAVFKYKGGNDGIERLKTQQREKLDLTDVPKQQLIMKPSGKGSSASKYKGVSLNKASNKWVAQITIDGKRRYVGYYDNEEDAAADYARAVFKYKGGNAEGKRQDELQQLPLNLIQVPAIPPAGYDSIKGGPISASKVTEYEI